MQPVSEGQRIYTLSLVFIWSLEKSLVTAAKRSKNRYKKISTLGKDNTKSGGKQRVEKWRHEPNGGEYSHSRIFSS